MFLIIVGVTLGVIALGWVYHRYTAQTAAVIDQAAVKVNAEIDAAKKIVATATANTAK